MAHPLAPSRTHPQAAHRLGLDFTWAAVAFPPPSLSTNVAIIQDLQQTHARMARRPPSCRTRRRRATLATLVAVTAMSVAASGSTCSGFVPPLSLPMAPRERMASPAAPLLRTRGPHVTSMVLGRRPPTPATKDEADDGQKNKARARRREVSPPKLSVPPGAAADADEDFHSPIQYGPHDHHRALQGTAVVALIVTAIVLVGATENFQHVPDVASLVPPTYSFEKSLLSGAAAGISRGLSRILTFPLDTIKTRQQAVLNDDDEEGDGEDEKSGDAGEQLAAKASKVEKGRLFDGLLPMLLIAGPANAAFFVTYDYLRALALALGYPPKDVIVELCAALLASLPANFIRIPAEVTKQRVQAGLERKASTAAANIWRAEGPLGLYVGGGAHLARELPFNAVQFLTFRNLKEALVASQGGVHATVASKAVLGAIAAGLASLATQPLDTIKTAQMLDKTGAEESYVDGVKRIYGRFGLPGLYLGLLPRFFLCAIGGSFYFFANEWSMSVLTSGGNLLPNLWPK